MIKQSNNQWIHISDDKTHDYPVKFSCSRNDTMIPYVCFYTKDDTNVRNAAIESESVRLTSHMDDLSEIIDFSRNDDNDGMNIEPSSSCILSDIDFAERMKLEIDSEMELIVEKEEDETVLNDEVESAFKRSYMDVS